MSAGERPKPVREDAPEPGPAPDRDESADEGPVPVRDLMKQMTPEPVAEGEPRWEGTEHAFERDGVGWTARTAGAGLYGTGDLGTSRLVAVHFYRDDRPERPIREALVPAGVFPHMRPDELERLYDRATPIEWDD